MLKQQKCNHSISKSWNMEGLENLDANRKSTSDRKNSQCLGPEAGLSLACLRNSEEDSGWRGASKGEEGNSVDGGISRAWATQRKA